MRRMNSNKFLDDSSMSPIYTTRRQSPMFRQFVFAKGESNLEEIKKKVREWRMSGKGDEELQVIRM